MYRKAIRILDLECIVRANQQQEKVPVKRVSSNAALNSEMDWSSPVKRDRGAVNWLKCNRLKKEKCWSRHGGSRVSHVPWQKIENCRYLFTPMLSGLRWPGQTIMGSWPPAEKTGFTSLEMVHTHAPPQRGFLLRPGRWDEDENEGK